MGSLCSPDHIDPQAEPNTMSTPRGKTPDDRSRNGGYNNGSSNGSNHEHIASPMSIDPAILNQLEFIRSMSETQDEDTDAGGAYSNYEDSTDLSQPSLPLPSPMYQKSNTAGNDLKDTENELSLSEDKSSTKKKKAPFQIVVTPAQTTTNFNNGYSPIPNGAQKQTDGTEANGKHHQNGYHKEQHEEEQPEDLIMKQKKRKIDSTLGGKIDWKKVADFSALLPRDVKLKLWNGVFKAESDYNLPEQKRISKVLRTFVMLQLTREYKKTNTKVPDELKQQLSGAVKDPSKFIAQFLKKDEKFIDHTLLTIYETICHRFKTNDESKKAKYAKKAKMTQDNYAELTREDLRTELNEEDYLKTAFLQYMLYAYQIKLDTDSARNGRNK